MEEFRLHVAIRAAVVLVVLLILSSTQTGCSRTETPPETMSSYGIVETIHTNEIFTEEIIVEEIHVETIIR